MVAMPAGIAIAVPVAVKLLGGFSEPLVGENVSALTAFGILGTMCFPLAAYYFARARRDEAVLELSRSWPTVSGVIEECERDRRHLGKGYQFRLKLRYRYEAGGRVQHGTSLSTASEWLEDHAFYETLAQKYAVNNVVPVHVDPSDPTNTVLETSREMAKQRHGTIGAMIAVPLVATLVVALRNMPG